jgi:predicted kinase
MSANHTNNTSSEIINMPPQAENGSKSPCTTNLHDLNIVVVPHVDEEQSHHHVNENEGRGGGGGQRFEENEYYEKGSVELAVETPVMMQRLEKRRMMTKTSERLLIVLVGLPARGKSFISRKLYNYLTWRGNACKVFNVGQYRRQATTEINKEQQQQQQQQQQEGGGVGVCNASFFDDSNQLAAEIRERAAQVALKDTLEWLEDNDKVFGSSTTSDASSSSSSLSDNNDDAFYYGHTSHSSRRQTQRIAIFDATNSTRARRAWILQQCDEACELSGKQTGVVFVESICDDKGTKYTLCTCTLLGVKSHFSFVFFSLLL